MASKRKSTVPCMIPSKSKHAREEIILGSLPELLPTIPEDGILSISGEESGRASRDSSHYEGGSEVQKGGAYACPPCSFESRDLNYFLDHMHNRHPDFRAQPTFYCLNCGVSAVRFEALALHNAKAHVKITEGSMTASLSVGRRGGVTAVEQSLFADADADDADRGRESAISLSKTPIAKMMRAKGEHKKIVVSHTVELLKKDGGRAAAEPTNVPELQNGALGVGGAQATPRAPAAASNRVFHQQHAPSLYSPPPPSSESGKDLPKVMIPLSSIPTYDAAMDTSSFLKTSFGKFPYPTKAELCYLTVVSEFPEEQIKLWFTAQRLKQGISWSPEEIEEARRKMFNTVFQGGAPRKQPAAQRHVNHIVTHRTVTASGGANFAAVDAPYGGVRSRPGGLVPKMAAVSTGPRVTRVSYSAPLLLAHKLQSLVRTAPVAGKNIQAAAAAAEPEKSSNGLGADAAVAGCGGGGENFARRNGNNGGPADGFAACAPNISNNDVHYPATPADKTRGGTPTAAEAFSGRGAIENTSDANQNNHDRVGVQGDDGGGMTNEHPSPRPNHAGAAGTEDGKRSKELSVKTMSILQQLIKDDELFPRDGSGGEQKMEPIKVNFKRVKVNESESAAEIAHPDPKSELAEGSFPALWANKNARQLRILRRAFSGARWPNSQQYEELSVQTGLPKSEVVRWFSDSRYSHKNGQLKWLESYLRPAADAEEAGGGGGGGDVEAKWRKEPPSAPPPVGQKKRLERDGNKGLLGEGRINTDRQRLQWQDFNSPLHALMASEGRGELVKAETSAKAAWPPQRDHQRLAAGQPLLQQPNDANQNR